ncbi:hypothetical protein OC846_004921 [Tilletia horrida]|uniref:DDHD domain-containing protein n=1 Tax=Tilletia horrida TaxID=155126 RepID=A0AAN6GME6_9BASI|nr:hypothetical protein OC846_004921 [Tilletia horrida]KAK0563752.1 hypothetical protein OC861_004651 [Tilletia horrida]
MSAHDADDPNAQAARSSRDESAADPRWFYARGRDWVTFDDENDAQLELKFTQLGGPQGWKKLEQERLTLKEQREAERDADEDEEEEDDDDDDDDVSSANLRAPPSGTDKLNSLLPVAQDGGEKVIKKGNKVIVHRVADPDQLVELQSDQERAESDPVVPVFEDNLFSVDVARMELFPAFWKGVLLRVVRSTWFYVSESDGSFAPIAWNEGLAQDLDDAYAKVRPQDRFPRREEQSGNQDQTSTSEEKNQDEDEEDESLTAPLPSLKNSGSVKFIGQDTGRIFSKDLKGRLLSLTGGSLVVRGWKRAQQLANENGHGSLFDSLPKFSLPWVGGDSDSDDDDDDDNNVDSMSRKKRGQTMGAHRAGRKEGAARAPRRNPADPRGGPSKDASKSESSDAGWARLLPSSDAILRPRYSLYRMMGWDDEHARDEAARHEKDKTTRSAVRGSSWWGFGSNGAEDDDDDEDDDLDSDNATESEDRKDDPPELVLVIHGIGQALTDTFDAIDFAYDVEKLRALCGKLSSSNKQLRKLSRGKRVQFIPVCWRQGLDFDQHDVEGNDNFYTLSEVNAGAAIPFVRNVISKVILDVPYYLSNNKQKMVDAARAELNRVYKLWCLRNPDFEKSSGRVSIIGHSLGSALCTDLLSEQPTEVPPLHTLTEEERKSNKYLLFNTRHAYLCGSPQGFFYYLNGGQLIARKGTHRTREGVWPEDATRDEPRYGCLAAESVYNIFDETDPVAFSLSATVDSMCASVLRGVELSADVQELQADLGAPQISISKILQLPSMMQGNKLRLIAAEPADLHAAYQAALEKEEDEDVTTTVRRKVARELASDSLIVDQERSESEAQARRARTRDATKGLGETSNFNEKAAPKGKGSKPPRDGRAQKKKSKAAKAKKEEFDLARLERGQARLNALNPHGRVDFMIPSDGLSEYIEMIGAHMSYWTSSAFATFILTQTYAEFAPGPPQDDNVPGSGKGQTRAAIQRRLSKATDDMAK